MGGALAAAVAVIVVVAVPKLRHSPAEDAQSFERGEAPVHVGWCAELHDTAFQLSRRLPIGPVQHIAGVGEGGLA